MRILIFCGLFLLSIKVYSQKSIPIDYFSKKEIRNLNQLNLSLGNYTFNDYNFNKDLKDLAYYNAKRKQNKVWAYVFSTAGTLLLASGLAIDSEKDLHGFKTLMYVSSAAYYGVSIPFFVGNIKNKNRLKKELIFVEERLTKLQ